MRRVVPALLAAALLAVSCSDGGGGGPSGDEASAAPEATVPTVVPAGDGNVCLEALDAGEPADKGAQSRGLASAASVTRIADLDQPTGIAFRCDDDAVYVTEKEGRVVAVRGGSVDPTPVLDLSGEVKADGVEQGLLGLAFSPSGEHLYVDFTGSNDAVHVVEYALDDSGRVDLDSRRELLTIPHPDPEPVHQAGHLTFGLDGMLYIAMGDGGPGQRQEAQNLGSLYGTIMRVDPRPNGDAPYGVPADNPFAGRDDARGEIWVWGLRNPWRFSFDRATGDLWVGDVGDLHWEEVSMVPADEAPGTNFGWPAFEGRHPHVKANVEPPEDARPPVYDYAHPHGCGVIGGYVYRGSAIPLLRGSYVFGDLCTGKVSALVVDEGDVTAHVDLTGFEGGGQAIAFGEDPRGELYVVTFEPGALWRLDPAE